MSIYPGRRKLGVGLLAAAAAVLVALPSTADASAAGAEPDGVELGAWISIRATTADSTDRYIRHHDNLVITSVITRSSSNSDKGDATWIVRRGLADASCVSFESANFRGDYLRHRTFRARRELPDGTALFRADATFCPKPGKSGPGISFASYNYPNRYLRHILDEVYVAGDGGFDWFETHDWWAQDVTWKITEPWLKQK